MFTGKPTGDSVYEFSPVNIDGKKMPLKKYKGKTLLIVNTASECGFTSQFEELQSLYEKYHDRGFTVLGFPANNFRGQEPGTDKEIKKFCSGNFDVTFPMFSKVSVKGANQHPLFTYLTLAPNNDFSGKVKWNFEKFLVDKDGHLARRFRSKATPESNEILKAIDSILDS